MVTGKNPESCAKHEEHSLHESPVLTSRITLFDIASRVTHEKTGKE